MHRKQAQTTTEPTMMRNKDFCVFILTHGRADNVKTYGVLRNQNYTGMIRLVVDDEDSSLSRYREIYGPEVIVFSKDEAKRYTDPMDNFHDRRTPLYARNICWQLAASLNVSHFVVFDDDYSIFGFRYNKQRQFITDKACEDLDTVFDAFVDFLKATPTTFIAMAQNGDFIGGGNSTLGSKIFLKRKSMNSFFCKTDTPCYFHGTFNDDVNTYVLNGNIGKLCFTHNVVSLHQGITQKNAGGITEAYKAFGTYVKSFYTVMLAPSCTKIAMMGNTAETLRIHHKISWKYCVPKILDERWRKGERKKSIINQK